MATNKPVTLRDIATRMGVNVSTVSLALKNNQRISATRRAEVQAVARQLKYRVNPHAATLAHLKHRSTRITAALAWINDWPDPDQLRTFKELDAYWLGAFDAAEKRGYRLEEFRWSDVGGARWLGKMLKSRGIRGGLVVPPYRGMVRDWSPLLAANFIAVKFGLLTPGDKFKYQVTSDQALNSRLAFQKMEQAGYRRIGFVTRVNDMNKNALRAGYLIAQLSSNKSASLPPLALSWSGEESNLRELEQWLKKHRPDAIFTNIGNLKSLLLQLNKRVPEDIGLVGTSILDVDTNAGIDPQPYLIGKAAVEWVISLVQHHDPSSLQPSSQLLIKGKWVDGEDLPPK